MNNYQEGVLRGIEMSKEIAEKHISYSKRNELLKKFPSGDNIVSMAGMIHMALWALEVELTKQYSNKSETLDKEWLICPNCNHSQLCEVIFVECGNCGQTVNFQKSGE